MQSIFALSRQSMSNNQRLQEISQRIDQYAAQRDELAAEYDELYLNKAHIAAFIIDTKPELADREKLAELSSILSLESVNIFDQSGVQVATNSPYTRFTVSDDPEDQSYEFNKLLLGVDSLVQEAQPDDVSGRFPPVHRRHHARRAGQPQRLCADLRHPLAPGSDRGKTWRSATYSPASAWATGGVVSAVNKADGIIAYHPNSRYIGRDAYTYGITEESLVDRLYRLRHLREHPVTFASTLETDEYIVFAAVPEANIGTARLPVTLVAGAASCVALLLVILMLCLYRDNGNAGKPAGKSRRGRSTAGPWWTWSCPTAR